MSNLVLYRKHRPSAFRDVRGQEHIVRTITNAIARGEAAHSYLFAGPRGTGKTTLARLIGKSLNCENRKSGQYEPCGTCGSCADVAGGTAVDIIEIDAASNRGIDEIRDLKEGIRFAPARGRYKIYIVDEVHMLTKDAFNALLKTLEEPPSHAIFVLATTELNKVLPTIISRSQKFEFRRLSCGEIKDRLVSLAKKEGKKLDPKVFEIIAARAEGSARDGESMLGQVISVGNDLSVDDVRMLFGLADIQRIGVFMNCIADKDAKGALAIVSEMGERGVDQEEFAKSLLSYIRSLMFLKIDASLADVIAREMSQEDLELLRETAQRVEMPHLQKAANAFLEASANIKHSPIPELPIEMAIVELSNE